MKSDESRDPRLDFLRGTAMAFVIMFHLGGLSLFHLFAMIGIEIVAGGEVFVLMSGIALGIAQRVRVERDGWNQAGLHLLVRAGQLYALFVLVTMSAWALSQLPVPHADVLTAWRDQPTDPPLSMFGNEHRFFGVLAGVLLLRYGPWQYGIVGLFVVLALLSPLAIRLLVAKRWWLLLLVSWILYAIGVTWQLRIFEGVFEGGAPFLTWQLIFFHGLAIGYHMERVMAFMYGRGGRVVIVVTFILAVFLIAFSMNAPWVTDVLWSKVPRWASLGVLSPAQFQQIQHTLFGSRQWPHLGRIITVGLAAVFFTTLLTVFWRPANRLLGWLMVPLGEQALLVFSCHVFVLFIVAQLEIITPNAIVANTLIQMGVVLFLWLFAYGRSRHRRAASAGHPVDGARALSEAGTA